MALNRNQTAGPLGPDEAVLVIGNTSNARIILERIKIDGDTGRPLDRMTRGQVTDPQAPRFSIWRIQDVKNAPNVGIVSVHAGNSGYQPCEGARLPYVALKAGEVIYVGDMSYTSKDKAIVPKWTFSEAEARRTLRSEMPDDADKLTVRELSFVKSDAPCQTGPTIITIPVGGGR